MFSILKFKEVKNMKVVTITSLKGGVGKSAIASNLADFLSYYGRTLLIDANQQSDSSKRFIYKENKQGNKIDVSSDENRFENIFNGKSVTPLTVKDNLDILIATKDFQNVNKIISEQENPSLIFRKWLRRQKLGQYYDYVIVDTHNTKDSILKNFFLASDLLLAPTGADSDEVSGAVDAYDFAEVLRNDPNLQNDMDEPYMTAGFAFVGTRLLNGKDGSGNNQTKEFLKETKDNPLFIANIYDRNIFRDAASENTTIFAISNRSKYSGKSYERYFKKTQEAFLAIKNAIDAA